MKKILLITLLISFILCLSGCSFEDVSLLYSDSSEKNGFHIAINKTANCCFVGSYNCIEYTDNLEITIPDDYEGIPIKRIGGYYGTGLPTPFMISVADLYMNASKGSEYDAVYSGDIRDYLISENYTIEDIGFYLNIGKNIETIEYIDMDNYYPHINEDNSITFYHPVVSVNCSEENKFFYSKDGKLYNKATNELISDFAYKE